MTNFIFLHCQPLRVERAITCHGGEEKNRAMDVSVCVKEGGRRVSIISCFLSYFIILIFSGLHAWNAIREQFPSMLASKHGL